MKRLFTVLVIIGSSYVAKSQVVSTKLSPTRIIKGTSSPNELDSVKLHLAHPLGTPLGKDSALHIWHFDPDPPYSDDVGVDCRGNDVECLELSSSPAAGFAAIDSGVKIDAASGVWKRPNYVRLALTNAADNWDNQTDKYLGVRFKRNGQWHYGWIKMTIDGGPTMVELKAYAYEKTPGKGITTGDMGTVNGIDDKHANLQADIRVVGKVVHITGITGQGKVTVVDMSGKLVCSSVFDDECDINLANLPAAVYILQIQQANAARSYKIVME